MENLKNVDSYTLISELRERGYALAVWQWQDVMGIAENLEIPLTITEAVEICRWIDHKHDAEIGINWQTLEIYIEEYRKENPYQFKKGDLVEIQNNVHETLQEYIGKIGYVTKVDKDKEFVTLEFRNSVLPVETFGFHEVELNEFIWES